MKHQRHTECHESKCVEAFMMVEKGNRFGHHAIRDLPQSFHQSPVLGLNQFFLLGASRFRTLPKNFSLET